MTITRESADMVMRTGAVFSEDMRFRYRLWRVWNPALLRIAFVMCNPSVADEKVVDPTVRGCLQRAMAWGYGRLDVVNLCAFRATDPELMARHVASQGERIPLAELETATNYDAIIETCEAADLVVCAWGSHHAIRPDARIVVPMLRDDSELTLHALAVNKDGSPKHPLYVAHSVRPTLYRPATA